jgi:uncharacterized protein YndB with AHSA1/START domain
MATRGLTLEMGRTLPAACADVFDLFTDPNQLARWWGPAGFSVASLEFDARTGSTYRIEMQPPEGDPFWLTGEFRVVDPPDRLAYTFRWEDPDPDDVETIADLSFREVGESTELSLAQGPFKTEARRELHRSGWTDSFDRVAALL